MLQKAVCMQDACCRKLKECRISDTNQYPKPQKHNTIAILITLHASISIHTDMPGYVAEKSLYCCPVAGDR